MVVLPGPSAVETALVASGLAAEGYAFLGWVPRAAGERARFLAAALAASLPSVMFESPRRLAATLADLARLAPEHPVAVARELTKLHEEVVHGSAGEVAARGVTERGEVCLVRRGGAARRARCAGARSAGGRARARRAGPAGPPRERARRASHRRSAARAVRRGRRPAPTYTALMPRPGEPYYVTTPIYYVNGEPHLGHAYTTIAADVATRHARRCGADAFFLTGTDEHGAEGRSRRRPPRASRPRSGPIPIAERFRELAHDIEATNDFFIRTTDPEHEAFVQRFVERMRERGDLYESTYSGLYCTACEAFYNEDDLIDGRCPEHGTVPVFTEERNTFFRLSAYADALLERYAADPPFVLPQTRLNEVRSHVEGGLQDVSITRESVNWGVPLPWDSSQAIYVWIDALINYTSALTYARPGEDLTARLWPARWQLLGKDILRFHAVIWPAMLLSAGYELPQPALHPRDARRPGRPPHVEDARQRDGLPARGRRPTGPTRCATTCCARSPSARTAASATRACTTATTAISPTSSATSCRAASRW